MCKPVCLLVLLFQCSLALAQLYVTSKGEFMDTTGSASPEANTFAYYYSVDGKYPKSSATLLKEVRTSLQQQNNLYNGSGYITFRFVIDTMGRMMKRVQVLQTDSVYRSFHFDKQFVDELYTFIKSLNQWKIARSGAGSAIPYRAYISFKVKNGKVINILP